jgi:hypothetical protein
MVPGRSVASAPVVLRAKDVQLRRLVAVGHIPGNRVARHLHARCKPG